MFLESINAVKYLLYLFCITCSGVGYIDPCPCVSLSVTADPVEDPHFLGPI